MTIKVHFLVPSNSFLTPLIIPLYHLLPSSFSPSSPSQASEESTEGNSSVFRPPPEMLLAHPSLSRGSTSCRPMDPSEEDLSSGEVLSEEWNGGFALPAQPQSLPSVFRDVGGNSSVPTLRRATSLGPSPWSDSPDLAGVFRERAGDGPTLHPGNPIRSNPSTTENSTVSAASRLVSGCWSVGARGSSVRRIRAPLLTPAPTPCSFGSLASGSPHRPSSYSDLKSVHIDLGDTPLARGSLVGDGPDPLLDPENRDEEDDDDLRAAAIAEPLDDDASDAESDFLINVFSDHGPFLRGDKVR